MALRGRAATARSIVLNGAHAAITPLAAPIAFVQQVGGNHQGSTAATFTFTIPAGHATRYGNTLVAYISWGTSSNMTGVTVTDSKNNVWRRVFDKPNSLNVFWNELACWTTTLTNTLAVGDTITVAWTNGNQSIQFRLAEFSGLTNVAIDGPVQTTSGLVSSTAGVGWSPTTPSYTPVQNQTLVLAPFVFRDLDASYTFVDDSGSAGGDSWHALTNEVGAAEDLRCAYRITASAATHTYTPTITDSANQANDRWIQGIFGLTERPSTIAFSQQVGTDHQGATASTYTFTIPAGQQTTRFNVLVAYISWDAIGLTGVTVTDNRNNVWSQVFDQPNTASDELAAWTTTIQNALVAGDTVTVSWTSANAAIQFGLVEFSGLTTAVDGTVQTTRGTATTTGGVPWSPTSPSYTPTQAKTLVLAPFVFRDLDTSITYVNDAGTAGGDVWHLLTNAVGAAEQLYCAYRITTSAVAHSYTPSITDSANQSDKWVEAIFSLIGASTTQNMLLLMRWDPAAAIAQMLRRLLIKVGR